MLLYPIHPNSKQMTDTIERCVSVEEICKYLGVSKDTAYKWIDKNAMLAHRMVRPWKFKKTEVDDWIKKGGAADKPYKNE